MHQRKVSLSLFVGDFDSALALGGDVEYRNGSAEVVFLYPLFKTRRGTLRAALEVETS